MYDTYIILLKIVLPAVAFAMLIAMIISYAVVPPQDLGNIFGTIVGWVLGRIPNAVIQVFAWLTAIFALIEYFAADIGAVIWKKGDWNPADLPEIPAKGAAIKRSEPIAGIVFTVVFFILFSFAAGQFGLDLPNISVAPISIFNLSVLRGICRSSISVLS